MMTRQIINGLLLFFLFIPCSAFANTQVNTKAIGTSIMTGPLSPKFNLRYYIQPQIDLIDDSYKFNSTNLFIGAGYQPIPPLTFWIMNGWFWIQEPSGKFVHQDILREQIDYLFMNNPFLLTSLTRLEQRQRQDESQIAWRLRERIIFRYPLSRWEKHSFVVFDEVFLNINHPNWVNNSKTFAENWAFIGIGTQLALCCVLDVGYLNQYEVHKKHDQLNNAFYMMLNINFPGFISNA